MPNAAIIGRRKMTRLEQALDLAARGFHIFPCEGNGKKPCITDFPNRASRDPERITKWFANDDRNIGISTTRFGDDQALVVVDVDVKGAKRGDETLLGLELNGNEFPITFEQATPTGGRHIVYVCESPLKQGVDLLGNGLDIRSKGGYIIGPGSVIDGGEYRQINGHGILAQAPTWLVHRLGSAPVASDIRSIDGVDPDRAAIRAIEWVLQHAPTENDPVAYPVAAKLKDFGVTEEVAVQILKEHWDPRCVPPRTDDTETTVRNAYRYGVESIGIAAPEAVFPEAPAPEEKRHPVDSLNSEYAFIKAGAFVLQETTDSKGRFTTLRLSPNDMHSWFANKTLDTGNQRPTALSKLWMQSPNRREYESVVFAPGQQLGSRWYNLWRGFRVAPATTHDHNAVNAFLEHVLENVCRGDESHFNWLVGYMAHMVQKPAEKPHVALVFQGAKGTGKNFLVETIGWLLGSHFLVADDERYLISNFNSHLESNLFFVLDEASWAGDKRAEGKLKGLITGKQHIIERKGMEPYPVDNLTRVAILGNEKWLVPATVDERRFAVFNMGDGRRQDRAFFESIRKGMEAGGYEALLRYLMDYDISCIDVNAAPATQGLIDQKHASLEPIHEWWFDCVSGNTLAGGDWDGDFPDQIPTNRIRSAFEHWSRQRNIRSRLPGRNSFMSEMASVAPSLTVQKIRPRNDGDTTYSFINPGIELLRQEWELFIGGKHTWN